MSTYQNPIATVKPEAEPDSQGTNLAPTDTFELSLAVSLPKLKWDRVGKIRKNGREFLTRLKQLKGMGYDLSIEPGLFSDRVADSVGFCANLPQLWRGDSPLTACPNGPRTKLEVPRELNLEQDTVGIRPFQFRSREIKHGRALVEVVDYFNEEHPIIFREKISLKPNGEPATEDVRNILAKITPLLEGAAKAHQKSVRALEPDPKVRQSATYQIASSGPLGSEQRRILDSILAEYPRIILLGLKQGGEFDTASQGDAPLLVLSRDKLEEIGQKPIQINGQLLSMRLCRQDADHQTPEDSTAPAPTLQVDEPYTDRFGNYITHARIAGAGSDQSSGRIIDIQIPISFLETREGGSQTREISVDLSRLRPDGPPLLLQGLLLDKPVRPLDSPGPLDVYTNMSERETKRKFGPQLLLIQASAKSAAAYCGATQHLKRIYLVNGEASNAFLLRTNTETLVFQDELLDTDNRERLSLAASHEAYHLADAAFDWRLSGGAFQHHYQRLLRQNKSFLQDINETFFLFEKRSAVSTCSHFGHARDNSKELFASFVNSLNHPRWSERMQEMSPEFRESYLKTLRILRRNLRSIEGFPKDAPLLGDLKKRIQILRSLPKTAEKSTEAPPWRP